MNPIINHILSTKSIPLSGLLAFNAVNIILKVHRVIITVQIIEITSAIILSINEIELCRVKPHIQIISVSLCGIDAGVKSEINIKIPPINGKIQEDSFILLILPQLKMYYNYLQSY